MIVVSNRICVATGKGAEMAPRFTSSKDLCDFVGFVKVEVVVIHQEAHDEMNVNMYWHSMEDFQVWRHSDAFKAAHKRAPKAADDANLVISSTLLVGNIAASLVSETV